MHIILLRHFQSEKNINETFSSTSDNESLTSEGETDAKLLAKHIYTMKIKYNLYFDNIYCASSLRSIESANIIKNSNETKVLSYKDLCSTRAGILSGKSELEAQEIMPEFAYQLKLYRAGLFNSYKFAKIPSKESKGHAEKRVLRAFDKIISDTSESLKVIIAHRSAITTILINLARKYYSYPKDFFGYIQLDLGHVSWFMLEKNSLYCFGVNLSQSQFNNLLAKTKGN